jgi:putative NADPH-quinone reductase
MGLWVTQRRAPTPLGHIARMSKRVLIIVGHPDASEPHYCHALARAYEEGAAKAGHEVRVIDVGRLEFPVLRQPREFENGDAPPAIRAAQQDILWAEHLLIVYPLWLGTLPALLKAFFEQTFRYGFALAGGAARGTSRRLLAGRSARVVVTMGMPAILYRWLFRAHGLRSLEKGILWMAGIRTRRARLIGLVEGRGAAWRRRQLDALREMGRHAK